MQVTLSSAKTGVNALPVSNYQDGKSNKTAKNIPFKNFIKAMQIEHALKKEYGIKCDFGTNSFVAECVSNTAKLFEYLFGKDSLPSEAKFFSFEKNFRMGTSVLGMHQHYVSSGSDVLNGVYFNSDNKSFKTKNKLKFNEMTSKLFWWHPTGNYLQTFVHEFAHSAHYKHLCKRGNGDVMTDLNSVVIPTIIGRFIAKFKLGRYSATNMNEFMAERITKDICKHLNSYDQYIGSREDVSYQHIFLDRWKYRYSSPQAYLDYYTQQIWNGDRKKADEVANDMDRYLQKVLAAEVAPVVSRVKAAAPKKTVWERIANSLFDANKELTEELDRLNELDLRPQIRYY